MAKEKEVRELTEEEALLLDQGYEPSSIFTEPDMSKTDENLKKATKKKEEKSD